MTIRHDVAAGEISEDGIRYLLMRPDVLMGTTREIPGIPAQAVVAAMAQSALRNAQASFAHYQTSQRFDPGTFLTDTFDVAARLGWGVWSSSEEVDGVRIIDVTNSPFAAGCGASEHPVCGFIVGVLQAVNLVLHGTTPAVKEIACAAQGAPVCRFHVQRPGRES